MKPGGCERSLADLLCHMDFSRYDVDLLLFEDVGPYAEELPGEVRVIFYDITKAFGSYMACIGRAARHCFKSCLEEKPCAFAAFYLKGCKSAMTA